MSKEEGDVGGDPAPLKTLQQISSGGVIFRREADAVYVALIAVKGGRVWELPKGIVEEGENIARTAHREVKEETGLDGKIIKKIGYIHYFYSRKDGDETKRFLKIVYFFLMKYTGGDVSDHDYEVDDCRWFTLEDAVRMVEYDNEREILKKAGEIIAQDRG